jgi:hypothetical protein
MYRSSALLASFVAATFAAHAAGHLQDLKGSYGFTGSTACLVAPGYVGSPSGPALPNPTPGVQFPNSGFQANLQPNDVLSGPSASFSRSSSVEGISTFNGDGTGTIKGTIVGTIVPPTPGPGGYPHFPPGASSSTYSYSFNYTVDGEGGWTATMVPGTYAETFVTGARAGETSTVDSIPPVVGMISRDRTTLIAAPVTPTVETYSYSNGDVAPQICHRSQTFIKLKDNTQ